MSTRPRILRRGAEGVVPLRVPVRPNIPLQTVPPASDPVEAKELWIGIHITTFNLNVTLEQIAAACQRFSPRVSVAEPDGVLLEVKGSLHLFGGLDGLVKALQHDCLSLGIESRVGVAPTPLAAAVGARVGQSFKVTNRAQLVGQLGPLPLGHLRWPIEVVERLARMGVRSLGQVLRLPRAGFARRFGPICLSDLDRLVGRSADLRHRFMPRERFRRRRELTYELENNEHLIGVLAPLLADLGRFLELRQCGLMELECQLRHRQAPPTLCVLRLSAPMADIPRLTELLREKLTALVLPEPVRTCELRSGLPMPRSLESNSIWQPGEYGGGTAAESSALIETLRARFGNESVYGLQVLPAHRPEKTWAAREPAASVPSTAAQRHGGAAAREPATSAAPTVVQRHDGAPGSASARSSQAPGAAPWPRFKRPVWLLPIPVQLDEVDGQPRRRGVLRLASEVERIETGWWDGGDVGRDYFSAFDIYGVQLWIYRERSDPHRWFLHGVFG